MLELHLKHVTKAKSLNHMKFFCRPVFFSLCFMFVGDKEKAEELLTAVKRLGFVPASLQELCPTLELLKSQKEPRPS